jgi:hypothetical protein
MAQGAVRVIDFLPPRGDGPPRLMRIVKGLRGRVPMRMELSLRLDYGSIVPLVEPAPDGIVAMPGPDAFRLSTDVPVQAQDGTVRVIAEGARERHADLASVLRGVPAGGGRRIGARAHGGVMRSGRCAYQGAYRDLALPAQLNRIIGYG